MGGTDLPQSSDVETLRRRFAEHGQEHVFQFWDSLGASEREGLLRQAASIDLASLLRARESILERSRSGIPSLEPIPVERLPEHGGDPARAERARARGDELLAAGRVAALVVAGGQATRLGYDAPKGMYPIGPVSGRSLFEVQAQKLRRIRARTGRPLPWYVMTSPATDAVTRRFFAEHDRFGLPEDEVFFFCQGMVPSFDFDGRLMLTEPGRIFENPNGHGGCLTALLDSGAIDDMERRGVETLFYYQVDNPMIHIADPTFLGFHALAEAQVSCKVIAKRDPGEKMGVLALADGRPAVVEYTEIDDAHRLARDASGELLYWAGNTAIHAFALPFLRRVASDADRWLPYHASAKKIPVVDPQGRPRKPETPNGHKLERFVFDALPAAERVCVVEGRRQGEYSPVKNAEGEDSPASARRDLCQLYRSWLEQAGVEPPPEGHLLEIDHARVDGAEDLRALGIARHDQAGDTIRSAAEAAR